MRDVWGLIVALTGLLFIWLWATGRASAAWQSIVSGNAAQPVASGTASVPVATLNPNAVLGSGINENTIPQIHVTPFNFPTVPLYIPTVGSLSVNAPTTGPQQ